MIDLGVIFGRGSWDFPENIMAVQFRPHAHTNLKGIKC